MLEAEKYWCENCCNWDKEEVQMDAYSTCKLTGTRVFAQESGKECKCFNVPAEKVIVLPNLKHKQVLYMIYNETIKPLEVSSYMIRPEFNNLLQIHLHKNGFNGCCTLDDFGKTVFLTKEEAEQALVNYESSKSGK